jgi:hypothetical protein
MPSRGRGSPTVDSKMTSSSSNSDLSQSSPAVPGNDSALRGIPGVGIFTLGGVVVAFCLVAYALLRTDNAAAPPSSTIQDTRSLPSQPRCSRQDVFQQAMQGGASGLRSYLRECQRNGAFIQQATSALETLTYDATSSCIASSCSANSCLSGYTADFPSGARLATLQAQAQRKASADECQPYCAQQAASARVLRGSVSDMRSYVRQCQPTGRFVDPVKQELERRLHADSASCIRKECDAAALNNCLAIYSTDFPYGASLNGLRNEAMQMARSPRCRSAAPPDQHWCPYPGASAGWWCPASQRCNPAGGCVVQRSGPSIGPIGVPTDIGTPAR